MKQTSFQLKPKQKITTKKALVEIRKCYGGSLNYRKLPRPLDLKKTIHIIMRSGLCRDGISLRHEAVQINKLILKFSLKFNVRIYKHSINSNHLHLIIKLKDREGFSSFISALAGSIALKFKLKHKIIKSFWDGRPFTRPVTWGREFNSVCNYITKNFKETVGFQKYTPRVDRYQIIATFNQTTLNTC